MEVLQDRTPNATRTMANYPEYRKKSLVDTGLNDSRGRAIGMIIETAMVDFFLAEPGGSFYTYPVGKYFAVYCQATRNGKSYGASQGWSYFSTDASRSAYIEKRKTSSIKAAQKKAA